jgi:antitoxin (DNA-binding transcriptional repressor) of toxin-antitoxin stability system
MSTYSIAQAKDQLSRLVDQVLDGEEVTITRHGKPVVEMRPATLGASHRVSKEDIEWLRHRRTSLPSFEGDSVALIREMRDEE